MGAGTSEENEQNIVTVEGEGQTLVFKQIAGLLARRIVFTKKTGERVERGERIGMIKFGSRVDVIMEEGARLAVKTGERVRGGASLLATMTASGGRLTAATVEQESGGGAG
jgi:phosphatidylserine decarboxylase